MGEIADAMINGAMCPCGVFIEDFDEPGYQRFCSPQCERDYGGQPKRRERDALPRFNRYSIPDPKIQKPGDPIRSGDRMSCPFCVKRPKVKGFGDHMLSEHRDKWAAK